jgi:hypothetical protein
MQFTQQFGVETKMKICTKNHQPPICSVPLVGGNIYCRVSLPNERTSLYLCTTGGDFPVLHSLRTGHIWSSRKETEYTSHKWTDVTDQYCLQEK